MNLIEITYPQLILCLIFVAIAGTGSIVFRLGLEKDLAWGSVRTFAQLFIMGYVLKFIFQLNNVIVILLLFAFMIFWAAHAIRGRVQEDKVAFFLPTFISMIISYMLVTFVVTAVIVQVKPWYTPQYFIPLGGMIIGNAMNAVTIALERFFSDLRKQRAEIELALCLGATYQEATHGILRDVIKAGMIPSINALMTVGLVSLPGMMTGQILAGSDPLTAIKYQIIVMLMIVASTAIGAVLIVHVVRRRCFTRAHQMVV
ncbi:MAG: iron export ABC transporter permease subunit FetB [Candidatus Latescibacteria bacterium]|jgi:putative ABC transport system permease protein|nr:iron export ABC transporter permease subunit FetB [Candidatus Latescibacterota bacterium]